MSGLMNGVIAIISPVMTFNTLDYSYWPNGWTLTTLAALVVLTNSFRINGRRTSSWSDIAARSGGDLNLE
jgi:hypothetical protein